MTDHAASAAKGAVPSAIGRAEMATLVGAVTGIQMLATLAALALATLAPDAATTFGIEPQAVGYQVSLIYAAAALCSLAAGGFVQRNGAGTASLAALLFCAAGIGALASGSMIFALAGSLMIGVGYALTNPAASTLLLHHVPPRHRNLIFSVKQTGVPLGGIVAGLLLPLIASQFGWQVALATAGLATLVVALLLAPRRAAWNEGRRPTASGLAGIRQGLTLVLRDPGLRALSCAAFCFAAIQLCLMSFAVTLLVMDLGWTLITAGAALSVLQLSGGVARLVWGRLADWTGRGDLVLAGIGSVTVAAALCMPLLTQDLGPLLVLGVLVVFAAGAIGWNGVFIAEIARQSPIDQVGQTTGAVLFFTFMGVVIGPAGFTLLFGVIGSYGLTFAAFAGLPLLGSLFLLRDACRR